MEHTILLGLGAAVLLTAISGLLAHPPQPPQPPQIIYVQTAPPQPTGGAGCLPLLILAAVILVAIGLS